ncbi:hypothetical protein AN958_10312, partial [Leucoagaricus sp. SymC.cos]
AAGNDNPNLAHHGKRVILPSSHIGSDRHMHQLFQDSMAICRANRKPDLFVTMTANPNWEEIQSALLPGQTASDRPDIVARVFEQKKKALLKEIMNGLFGKCVAKVDTNEFQKRGLPHIHILIFFHSLDKIRDANHVDTIVSAKIPDRILHPVLYDVVTTVMMHGPCGDRFPNARCMVNGRCSKQYPKPFNPETLYGEDGYPRYARPENGPTFTKAGFTYDNRWVVPYNPYLSARYVNISYSNQVLSSNFNLDIDVTSMLRFVLRSNLSSTFTNTSIKDLIKQLWRWQQRDKRKISLKMRSRSI